MNTDLRTVDLPNGKRVPVLGQGTWHMGEVEKRRGAEIEALRLGIDLGMTLIDTAEMYADGRGGKGGRRSNFWLSQRRLFGFEGLPPQR